MAKAPFNEIRTVADVRHVANELGSFFFTKGAMKAFNSRITSSYYPVVFDVDKMVQGPHDFPMLWGYFITSERFGDNLRDYCVRRFELWEDPNRTGHHKQDIVTIGERYETIAEARKAAQKLQDDDVERYL